MKTKHRYRIYQKPDRSGWVAIISDIGEIAAEEESLDDLVASLLDRTASIPRAYRINRTRESLKEVREKLARIILRNPEKLLHDRHAQVLMDNLSIAIQAIDVTLTDDELKVMAYMRQEAELLIAEIETQEQKEAKTALEQLEQMELEGEAEEEEGDDSGEI